MRLRPIHFVPDVAEAIRFYETLGLTVDECARSGHWVEMRASAAVADDGAGRTGMQLNLVSDEPLEEVERRLRDAGFPPEGTIVDQAWGRSLYVHAPDGMVVQVDEQDRALYT
jgi:catechol 2,3-dioxygenase-like lactoylglutathione lyase family enzyme